MPRVTRSSGADVAVPALEDEGGLVLHLAGGVDTRHKALGRGLLIAAAAAELAGAVQPRHRPGHQGVVQLQGVDAVVFDGVARAEDVHPLQPGNGAEKGPLHILGQGGAHALDIVFVGVAAAGKRTTLSSIDGQYRGPVPTISPQYRGERSREARMMAWVSGVV